VSVTVYGQVNRAVLWWEDHVESNTYSVDNNYESSRFGLKGSAKITGDWSGGFRVEAETTNANSARLNQFNDDNANDPLGPLNVRWSQIYINNKQYGEVRLGLTGTPIYNITKDTNVTDLEDTMHSDNRMNQSFILRAKASPKNAEGLSTIRWSGIFPGASNRATLSYARRVRKARPTGRRIGRDSALRLVGSKTTSGARLCATKKNGARLSKSAAG
jgi:predicted porin